MSGIPRDGSASERVIDLSVDVVGTRDDVWRAIATGPGISSWYVPTTVEECGGRTAAAMLPTAIWPLPRAEAWRELTAALGIPPSTRPGDHVGTAQADGPPLAGTIVAAEPWRLSLLVDDPAAGTAILACEGVGDHTAVSVWQYLYGEEADHLVARDRPRWQAWLDGHPGSKGSE